MAFEVEAWSDFLVMRSGKYIIIVSKILAFTLAWKIVLEVMEIRLSKEMC